MGYDFTDDEDDAWDDLSLCEWDYDCFEPDWDDGAVEALPADFEHYGRISHWRKLGDVGIEMLKPVVRFDDDLPF